MEKQYILFAGCNGAGKSTLFQTCHSLQQIPRVNVDEIVRGNGSWKNPEDLFRAGLQAVRMIRRYLENGISFTQETTLCGRSIIHNIHKAKANGYEVTIYYVGIASESLALERIRHRVENGGHGIPEEDVRRRFWESAESLVRIMPETDRIELFDNSENMRWVASIRRGKVKHQIKDIPSWAQNILNEEVHDHEENGECLK